MPLPAEVRDFESAAIAVIAEAFEPSKPAALRVTSNAAMRPNEFQVGNLTVENVTFNSEAPKDQIAKSQRAWQ